MSEKIGRHKGALQTLLHEKKEISRLLQIVNSQIERHLSELEEEGLDAEKVMEELTGSGSSSEGKSRQDQPASDTTEDGEDAGDMLESDNDLSDRDFSPR